MPLFNLLGQLFGQKEKPKDRWVEVNLGAQGRKEAEEKRAEERRRRKQSGLVPVRSR